MIRVSTSGGNSRSWKLLTPYSHQKNEVQQQIYTRCSAHCCKYLSVLNCLLSNAFLTELVCWHTLVSWCYFSSWMCAQGSNQKTGERCSSGLLIHASTSIGDNQPEHHETDGQFSQQGQQQPNSNQRSLKSPHVWAQLFSCWPHPCPREQTKDQVITRGIRRCRSIFSWATFSLAIERERGQAKRRQERLSRKRWQEWLSRVTVKKEMTLKITTRQKKREWTEGQKMRKKKGAKRSHPKKNKKRKERRGQDWKSKSLQP